MPGGIPKRCHVQTRRTNMYSVWRDSRVTGNVLISWQKVNCGKRLQIADNRLPEMNDQQPFSFKSLDTDISCTIVYHVCVNHTDLLHLTSDAAPPLIYSETGALRRRCITKTYRPYFHFHRNAMLNVFMLPHSPNTLSISNS